MIYLWLSIPIGLGCFLLGALVGWGWEQKASQEQVKRFRKWLARFEPWIPQGYISKILSWEEISPYGMGEFHLGLFVGWEPWAARASLDLGFWSCVLEWEIPFSEERKKKLLAYGKKEGKGKG